MNRPFSDELEGREASFGFAVFPRGEVADTHPGARCPGTTGSSSKPVRLWVLWGSSRELGEKGFGFAIGAIKCGVASIGA